MVKHYNLGGLTPSEIRRWSHCSGQTVTISDCLQLCTIEAGQLVKVDGCISDNYSLA